MLAKQEKIEKLVIELQDSLDLEDFESKIYLTLLRTGPITASAIARNLNIDRARTYRSIDKLIDRKIVSTTLSSPKLCIPVEPENALKMALERKKSEIMKITKSTNDIIEKITSIRYCPSQGNLIPTLTTIQGRTNIYSDIAQMIENCNTTLFIVTTLEDISKMYHSVIPEKIKICEKIGGKVLLLVEMKDSGMIPFVKRFGATETRVCKPASKGRIVVQKDKQLIMSDSSIQSSNSETEFSLSTNSKEMINHIDNLCQFLWKSAKPIESISNSKKPLRTLSKK